MVAFKAILMLPRVVATTDRRTTQAKLTCAKKRISIAITIAMRQSSGIAAAVASVKISSPGTCHCDVIVI